jgi:hypothetical protein
MGSRCALHWYRRTAAGRKLRKSLYWRRFYERGFAAGLDVRRGLVILGIATPSTMQYPPKFREKWDRLTGELIAAFDKGIHNADQRGSEAEGR